MDGARFDALTRRLLIAGAAGGVIAPFLSSDVVAAKKCKKGRKRCGKRCCPRGQRCESDVCVRACANPGTCDLDSKTPACGGYLPNACACRQTPSGGSACIQPSEIFFQCTDTDPLPCDASTPCPTGQVCASACCDKPLPFRCFDPCAGPFP
ncbi:MAG TPA: hypothetical protein VFI22_19200 [Thermomicrobiales bacterium]|nr:hypothetical protein [Thermomicrobiales bacterium]